MAKKTQIQVVRHKQPTVSKQRFEMVKAAAKLKAKRGREVAAKRVGTLVGMAAGGAAGYAERVGKLDPKFTSPLAFGLTGVVLAFIVPETSFGKGKLGQMSAEAGAGLAAVASYKLGLGQAVIGEDDGPPAPGAAVEGQWRDG